MTTRRGFIGSFLAASALPVLGWADVGSPDFLSAARDPDGSFALYGLAATGESRFRVALPARGHAGAAHPSQPLAVVFARRPGSFALVLDCSSGAVLFRLTPVAGRAFNGHGAYSQDGSRLFTSEQRVEDSLGVVGIWDTKTYRRIAEVASGGIGPHELRRVPGGDRLVVANGGIQTDATDRAKLNIATMRPNISYLAEDGSIESQAELPKPLWKNSIRHLAVAADGLVACAMQWEGDAALTPPLLALHWRGGPLTLCPPSVGSQDDMHNYAGSVTFDASGTTLAITSPKGGVVQVFDRSGVPLYSLRRADVCGIGAARGEFLLTDGEGAVSQGSEAGIVQLSFAACAWDNHLVAVG